MSDSPFIQNVSEENFNDIVIEASYRLPVLVDFWADWCQPCKTLMPLLMKLAEEYNGKFLLAKVNTEENKALAAQHGVRSLPTVRLYINGEVADEFMGALPEAQIRVFLEKQIPNEADLLAAQVEDHLDQGELEQASALLEQAAGLDPDNTKIKIARAKLALAAGQPEQAREILDTLDILTQGEPEVSALLARLDLEAKLSDAPSTEELNNRLSADDNDSEARYLLALRDIEQQNYQSALEMLLALLQKDRKYGDDAARKTILEVFNLLGGEGELVAQYRSKLFNALH